MGNIIPVTLTLVGSALKYVCHKFHKNKHEVLEVQFNFFSIQFILCSVIIQNQQASINHMNPLNAMLGIGLLVKNSAHQL
jgi:hypothetical protein